MGFHEMLELASIRAASFQVVPGVDAHEFMRILVEEAKSERPTVGSAGLHHGGNGEVVSAIDFDSLCERTRAGADRGRDFAFEWMIRFETNSAFRMPVA